MGIKEFKDGAQEISRTKFQKFDEQKFRVEEFEKKLI